MRFLILHGWQNRRPPAHWQHWLAGQLTERGHDVDYPQLPAPDEPVLDDWLTELRTRVAALTPSGTVICHSLGCLLWLHGVARGLITTPVSRVLLVAPPTPSITLANREIAAFAPPPLKPSQLAAAAGHTRLIVTDNDPYAPEGAALVYGEPLGLDTELIPGGAHLNPASGYGPWPAVLDWCLPH